MVASLGVNCSYFTTIMADDPSLTISQMARSLLQYPQPKNFKTADQDRPWMRPLIEDRYDCLHEITYSTYRNIWDIPLLCICDDSSQTTAEPDGGMAASDPQARLDTREARTETLRLHADHKSRIPTPYISFTTDDLVIQRLVERRREGGARQGKQRSVVIDPKSRLRLGLPILHSVDEMRYYHVPEPIQWIVHILQ